MSFFLLSIQRKIKILEISSSKPEQLENVYRSGLEMGNCSETEKFNLQSTSLTEVDCLGYNLETCT